MLFSGERIRLRKMSNEDISVYHKWRNDIAVCWLRNLDRKRWSLAIPYKVNDIYTSMYPDLIVVRADSNGYIFDVLEPHDPSRKDNYPKAIGLAEFAEEYWAKFGRIQLIRLKKDRMDVNIFTDWIWRKLISETSVWNYIK